MNAWAQYSQLRKAAGSERRLLNRQLVDYIAVGRIHLVHGRHRLHLDRGADHPDPKVAIDSGGAVGVYHYLRMRFGFESLFRERQPVRSGGKIRNQVGAIPLGVLHHLQVGR